MTVIAAIAKYALGIVTINSRIEKNEKKMVEIEKNYLSRFEDMTAHITSTKEAIIEHQHAMELRLMDKIK